MYLLEHMLHHGYSAMENLSVLEGALSNRERRLLRYGKAYLNPTVIFLAVIHSFLY
jgi:hypothetical protein